MRKRILSAVLSTAFMLQLTAPALAQSPCDDERYQELKKKPLDEMSEREYEYFIQKDKECSEYQRAVLLGGSETTPERTAATTTPEEKTPSAGVAAGIVVLGLAALAIGGFVKMGGEKCTVTNSDIDCDEHSYNALNYMLMVAGGALALFGIAEAISASSSAFILVPVTQSDWGLAARKSF